MVEPVLDCQVQRSVPHHRGCQQMGLQSCPNPFVRTGQVLLQTQYPNHWLNTFIFYSHKAHWWCWTTPEGNLAIQAALMCSRVPTTRKEHVEHHVLALLWKLYWSYIPTMTQWEQTTQEHEYHTEVTGCHLEGCHHSQPAGRKESLEGG